VAKAEAYVPPDDPDFEKLAYTGYRAWQRDKPDLIAFDTETHGLAFYDAAFCFTAAWYRPDGGIEAHYFELDKFDSRKGVSNMLLYGTILVGHNLKFDMQKAMLGGLLSRDLLFPGRIHDTETLAHLDDEHRPKGLKDLMVSVLGYEDTIDVEIKSGPNKGTFKKVPREKAEMDAVRRKLKLTVNDPWSLLPRAVILPYAVADARGTLELYTKLRPLVERYDDLWSLYQQELELTLVLLDMEQQGLGLVTSYVDKQVKVYGMRVLEHENTIEQIVGKPVRTGYIPPKEKDKFFNPASNKQLAEFFKAAGFERDSYDKSVLKDIDHPLAPALTEMRGDAKLLNTYFRAMKAEARDGILHPSYRQNVRTGRMASGKERG